MACMFYPCVQMNGNCPGQSCPQYWTEEMKAARRKKPKAEKKPKKTEKEA